MLLLNLVTSVCSIVEFLLILSIAVLNAVALVLTPQSAQSLWILAVITSGLCAFAAFKTLCGGRSHRGVVVHRVYFNFLVCTAALFSAHWIAFAEIIIYQGDQRLFSSTLYVALDILYGVAIVVFYVLDEIRDRQTRSLVDRLQGPEKVEISAGDLEMAQRVISATTTAGSSAAKSD